MAPLIPFCTTIAFTATFEHKGVIFFLTEAMGELEFYISTKTMHMWTRNSCFIDNDSLAV